MFEHVVGDIGCEAIHYPACRLFPSRRVHVCRLRCCIVSSVDITPVAMPEQVLMYLIRPRCKLFLSSFSIGREVAIPLSIFSFPSVLHPRLGFVRFELLSAVEVLNPHALNLPCEELSMEAMRKMEYQNRRFNGKLRAKDTEYAEETERPEHRNLI